MVEVIQHILKRIIQPKMESLKENIISGVDTHDKYQYLVGQYRSLNDLQQDLRELLKKQEMFDDEDK
jgi:hypothetical protein